MTGCRTDPEHQQALILNVDLSGSALLFTLKHNVLSISGLDGHYG